MYYYEVLVASATYHGKEALTYSGETQLKLGSIVKINLRTRLVLGIISGIVKRPLFEVKPILSVAPFPPIPSQHIKLLTWLNAYYPAPIGTIVRQFTPPTEAFPKVLTDQAHEIVSVDLSNLPALSNDQEDALSTIKGPGTFLLHGITGSGKSRVYLELAAQSVNDGKSALILTPEIGLTAQLTATFRQNFGNNVYVLHSQLTAAERRDIYYKLLGRTTPCIVIGPRSALFSPIRNLGLVVLDEVHDTAYKNESAPHYQSSRVAAKLTALHNATLVLGSATLSVEDYYLAQTRNRPIVRMQELAKQVSTPITIEMIDLRKPDLFKRNSLLSDTLLTRIENALSNNEQALVFLNRRGTANVVLCQSCGWQSLCPNCDLTLTYHGDAHQLRCHVCGFTSSLPTSCPACNGTEILFKSVGTKAIVDSLTKLFPAARIQRFDTDAKKSERLEQHLDSLAAGDADIIVGTQMITKGLDLPKLAVVGIINADSSLLIPDYTAAEQTYQVISQVVGRVGRGHRAGIVVVQTYDPENTTLTAAVSRDWKNFYQAELAERKLYKFPPFVYLLKLRIMRATSASAEKAANSFAQTIAKQYPEVIVEGPAPSFHPRERGQYSWQLLIKHTTRSVLVDVIDGLPSGWSYDIDPSNLL